MSYRTFVAVDPAQRPRYRRRTARVLLIDDHERVLFFADRDPGLPEQRRWWITPGGGVDPGESDREAAVRELAEETGLQVAEGELLGPIWVRRVVHGYSDVIIEQDDVFFACWVASFEVSEAGHTEEERLTMTAYRWWSREELAQSDEEIWPVALAEIWAEADRRRTAAPAEQAAPLDGGEVEESSVPAGRP